MVVLLGVCLFVLCFCLLAEGFPGLCCSLGKAVHDSTRGSLGAVGNGSDPDSDPFPTDPHIQVTCGR